MAKLTAEQLKALPDSMFGLPKERKYPMPDEEHVRKAIQFFRYCEESKRPELAKNINRRAKELKMKLKIQPSSAFYKYADREILKEGFILVNEFHIGALSPIVPLDGQMMQKRDLSRNKTKAPLDRLKAIWDSSKSIEEKKNSSLEVAKDCITDDEDFDLNLMEQFMAIDDLIYILSESALLCFNNNEVETRKAREYDSDNRLFTDIINSHDVNFICEKIPYIYNAATIAKLIGYINYTTDFSKEEKHIINTELLRWTTGDKRVVTYSADYTRDELYTALIGLDTVEFTQDDEFIISYFCESVNQARVTKVFMNFLKNNGRWNENNQLVLTTSMVRFILQDMVRSKCITGFTIKYDENNNPTIFIKLNNQFWFGELIYSVDNRRYSLIMIKIYDPENNEYNQKIINYFQGMNIKFGIIIKTINSATLDDVHTLEAADFSTMINGIRISKNGSISLLFDFNFTWKEKLHICEDSIKETKENKDMDGYKNNLAFLFSLIAYINRLYIRENKSLVDSGGYDYKDAIDTLNAATTLFKKEVSESIKADKKFDFVEFYMKAKFNEKINAFDTEDETDLRKEVEDLYFITIR